MVPVLQPGWNLKGIHYRTNQACTKVRGLHLVFQKKRCSDFTFTTPVVLKGLVAINDFTAVEIHTFKTSICNLFFIVQ